MLKVRGHIQKYVMTEAMKTLESRIYEEWGISNKVDEITKNFINEMEMCFSATKWGIENNPNIKRCQFEYTFFGNLFNIDVFLLNYASDKECMRAKEFGSFNSDMNYENKTMRLFLGAVYGVPYPPTYDDIIKHEIQHIYKIAHGGNIKSTDKLLNNSTMFNEEFYNKLNNILKTYKDYKIRRIAYALYSSFDFERNGFIGGMDGVFSKMDTDKEECPVGKERMSIQHNRVDKLVTTECYKAYDNILKVLKNIDDISDEYIYEVFGYYKYKIKKILNISREKYLRAMSKILLKHSNVWGNDRSITTRINEDTIVRTDRTTFAWIM